MRLAVLFEQRSLRSVDNSSKVWCPRCEGDTNNGSIMEHGTSNGVKNLSSGGGKTVNKSSNMQNFEGNVSSVSRRKRKAGEVDGENETAAQGCSAAASKKHFTTISDVDFKTNLELDSCGAGSNSASAVNSKSVMFYTDSEHRPPQQGSDLKIKQINFKVDEKYTDSEHRPLQQGSDLKINQKNFGTDDRDGELDRQTEAMHTVDDAPQQALTDEEVERRVKDCLQCVQVLQCSSSQQLICTLHSLEATIASNPNISLLVVDPVSAFFWTDRCSDLNSSHLHKNMACVAGILKKMATSYGVVVAVTKQALVKSKGNDRGEGRDGWGGNSSSSLSSSSTRAAASSLSSSLSSTSSKLDKSMSSLTSTDLSKSSALQSHVEFLGKAWTDAVTHRYVCTKSTQMCKGVKTTRYTLVGASGCRQFTIDDSGVQMLL